MNRTTLQSEQPPLLKRMASLLQVMIAEQSSRRKGLASEAMTLLMAYAVCQLVRRAVIVCARFTSQQHDFLTSMLGHVKGGTSKWVMCDVCRTPCEAGPSTVMYKGMQQPSKAMAAPTEGAVCAQGVRRFRAKVGFDNTASQALFARLGFQETGRVAVFREVTLEWCPPAASREFLLQTWQSAAQTSYDGESPALPRPADATQA